jgi:uncharacterized protein YodC (DUF2158 family)
LAASAREKDEKKRAQAPQIVNLVEMELSMDFAIGDVAVLKSGGPKMTVEYVDGTDISCVWFEKTRQEKGTLPAATLAKQKSMPLEDLAKLVSLAV